MSSCCLCTLSACRSILVRQSLRHQTAAYNCETSEPPGPEVVLRHLPFPEPVHGHRQGCQVPLNSHHYQPVTPHIMYTAAIFTLACGPWHLDCLETAHHQVQGAGGGLVWATQPGTQPGLQGHRDRGATSWQRGGKGEYCKADFPFLVVSTVWLTMQTACLLKDLLTV